MILSRVGPDNKQTLYIFNFVNGVRHRSAAEGGRQPGDRRGVSETGAVINIVRADHRAREFLQEIVFLIGALG